MRNPRALKIAVWSLTVLLIAALGCAGYLVFQNLMWKEEVTRFASSAGRLEAHGLFRNGKYWLYRIDGQCDETHFSGQRDGPFEVWTIFFQPALGGAHRYATEHYVAEFNDQMRRMEREPDKFRKRMRLDRDEIFSNERK